MDVLRQALELLEQGNQGVLATIVARDGSGARPVGTKMLVLPSGEVIGSLGGGSLEAQVIREADRLFSGGKPILLGIEEDDNQDRCGGRVQIFLEPLRKVPLLLIVGAGHVGRALSQIAALAGFQVLVVDDREEALAMVDRQIPVRQQTMEEVFADLEIDDKTSLVICTRSHELDYIVLGQALATDAGYIGLLGSQRKRDAFFSRLRQGGVGNETLARIICPVGLAIGAVTPEEIAISIVAQLIDRHRQSNGIG